MTEQEPRKIPETRPASLYDALLVHGYWMSEPTPGHVKLGLRSHLAVRAASFVYDHSWGTGKIVVDLGHLWGPNYPSEGELMAKELEEKYGVPKEDIILRENAYSTGGEVKSIVELSKQNGWDSIADLAFSKHHLTIPRVYEEYDNQAHVEFISIENVLELQDDRRVVDIVRKLGSSRYEFAYGIYERAKWLAMHRPGFSYDAMEEKNKNARKDKGKDSPLPISFDVYKL
jgi:hypothetical protein